jgi:GST-like protein
MQLYARKGWGSAIVEAQLDFYGLPYLRTDVGNFFFSETARAEVRPFNPLVQVPTLVLADGEVLTESAAITLWLADQATSDALVPGPDAPERAKFLRWLIFLVANIYPAFTFSDEPSRFVDIEAARQPFRDKVDRRIEDLWAMVEAEAGTPWFLGERMSALDIYVGVMTTWRPRRSWFAREAPRLAAIASAIEAEPRLAATFARNQGGDSE